MGNNKYKVLIIEDDTSILNLAEALLLANSYQVLTATTCAMGKTLFSSYLPDIVLLDLGLPDLDGTEFIKTVRSISSVPIIVISARIDENDKIEALDMGANDYITKPFGTGELLARLRAALRTSRSRESADGKFSTGELAINYDSRTVIFMGEEIHFTQTEYNILYFLSSQAGKVLTYSAIINNIWGMSDDGSVKKLQVNMANIRKKLGLRPGDNRYIANELGVGYRMTREDE